MFVFLNDKFVSAKNAKISVFDDGFQHGGGLFDTFFVKNGKLQQPREHLARIRRTAKLLEIKVPFSDAKILKLAEKLIAKNKVQKSMLRILMTAQTFLILTKPIPQRPSEASVCFVRTERALPHRKTLNYLPSVLIQKVAEKHGFAEPLLVNRRGIVTEGARTNLFWVKQGKLFTTPADLVLDGIARLKVISLAKKLKLSFAEQCVKPAELAAADEIFLTNVIMGVWPVIRVEKRRKRVGKITQQLRVEYQKKYG